MKKIIIPALCCVNALFTGCQQADELETIGENLEMRIEASIGSSKDSSMGRYAGDTPNDAVFSNGDAIGLLVNEDLFVKWNYDGSNWSPEGNIVYWEGRESDHNFYAFYPYVANASLESVPMPSLVTQDGTMASLAACDFLVATATQKYGNDGTVSFTGNNAFAHVSSLVSLTIEGGGDMDGATLTEISFAGENLVTSSTYSFEEKKVILRETKANEMKLTSQISVGKDNLTFYFILNSETVNLSAVTLTIDYSIGNVNYQAKKIGIHINNDDKFGSGKQYAYTVTIVDQTLIISGNEIKDWENGESLGDITINGEII